MFAIILVDTSESLLSYLFDRKEAVFINHYRPNVSLIKNLDKDMNVKRRLRFRVSSR